MTKIIIDARLLSAILQSARDRLEDMGSSPLTFDNGMPVDDFIKLLTGRDALGVQYGNVRKVWEGLEPAFLENDEEDEKFEQEAEELAEAAAQFVKKVFKRYLLQYKGG